MKTKMCYEPLLYGKKFLFGGNLHNHALLEVKDELSLNIFYYESLNL